MGDNFGGAIERADAILKNHAETKKRNPFFTVRRADISKNDTMEDDPVMVNYSTLQTLLVMANRYMKYANIKFEDNYS